MTEQLSQQEIFDYALMMIRVQGKPSMRGTYCTYRSDDGCKCAIGHFIPDAEYKPEWDRGIGINVAALPHAVLKSSGLFNTHENFLCNLQAAHDKSERGDGFLKMFEGRMTRLAKQYGLQYTPPGKAKA